MSSDPRGEPATVRYDDDLQTLARYRAFGNAVLDVSSGAHQGVEDWLAHVAPAARAWVDEALVLHGPGSAARASMTLGCWAAIFEPRTALTWSCVASALAGYTTAGVRTRYRQHLQTACPGERLPNWNEQPPDVDEFCRGSFGQGGARVSIASTDARPGAVDRTSDPTVPGGLTGVAPARSAAAAPRGDGAPFGAGHVPALTALRETLGLGAFVRLARTISGPTHPWTLIVQIDAPPGAQFDTWNQATCITALAALAPFLQRGFDVSVGRGLAHRHTMLQSLTPVQTELLPLLIDGMKEQDISQTLNKNAHSVHDAVKGIYKNLGVRSRIELIRRWHQLDA